MEKQKRLNRSQPRLIELLSDDDDAVRRLERLALSRELQSAIDLFEIDLHIAPRCLYLLHPC
jgi:hypothetical protein